MSETTSSLSATPIEPPAGLTHSAPNPWLHALVALVATSGLAVLATFPLDWEEQAILGGVLCALAWIVHRLFESRTATMTLVGVSMFTTVRYLWWRYWETYSYLRYNAANEGWTDLLFVGALLGAETYAFAILALGYLQSAELLDRRPEPLPDDVAEWPTVDIFIPTYNEPLSVLKPTVLAAKHVDWPRDKVKVWVLDDGCREEIREFAERCGVAYVGRIDSRFAKAGNLNNTLQNSDGELVAIFDCDHVPTRSFLQMTVGAFLKDPRLSMLQTPHHFYTPDPIERNLGVFREIPNEGALFYGVVQKGNDFWNATSFAGSCAVLRRAALEEIGGIAVETVTEDAHTSLRLQKRGWNTAYLDIPQAAGLAAFSFRDHVNQRIRWARGLTQILRIEKPLWSTELKWSQRLCYFNSSIHFLYSVPRLIFLTAPLGYLILGLSNFYGYVLAILAYAAPHLFLSTMTNSRLQGRFRNPFWNEIFETLLAPFILIPTTLALISPRKGVFNVTPKSMNRAQKRYDWLMASPFLAIAALNLFGIGLGVNRLLAGEGAFGTLAINIAWACYSTMILGVVLGVAEEPKEMRSDIRIPARVPAFAVTTNGRRIEGVTVDISFRGARIETPDAVHLKQGELTTIGFDVFGQESRITGRVVRVEKWALQVRFANLTLAQEEALTRLIFSRADAWVEWNDSFPERYSPLGSMVKLVRLSLRGYGRVVKALFRGGAATHAEDLKGVSQAGGQPALPIIGMLVFGALLSTFPVRAQQAEPVEAELSQAATREASSFRESRQLSELGLKQPIVLQGEESVAGLRFWSPLTKVVKRASLELRYQTSTPAQSGDAALAVLLNDARVGLVEFEGEVVDGAKRAWVSIPADLFVSDNELSFALDRRCEPDCAADAPSASAWVRVERTSEVRIEGERLPVALELRQLPMPLLDLSLHRAPEIAIITSSGAAQQELQAAGVAASWLGVLADHRGVRFTSFVDELPKGHAVVVARSGSKLAKRLGLGEQTEAAIALKENPVDPYGTILALVGKDAKDLESAARALATSSYKAEGSLAEVGNFELPPARGIEDAPRWLNPSQPIAFTELAPEDELRVLGNSALDLYIRTPPNLNFGSTRRLPLTLRYRVHDVPPDSTLSLTVLMNGVFVGMSRITDAGASADAVREDLFPVPVEAMYPNSTLQVIFNLESGRQEAIQGYPMLEILGSSELDLTSARAFAALPRLDLLAQSGFPFTRRADLSESAVAFGKNPGPAALSVFFNLMGFFGSNTGQSGLRLEVWNAQQAREQGGKDLLVIGEPGDAIFADWAERLTVTFEQPTLTLRKDAGGSEWGRRLSWGGFGKQRQELARALKAAGAPEIAMEGAKLPSEPRTLVAIMAGSPQAGAALAAALQRPDEHGEVYGIFSFLAEDRLHSFATAPASFYVGEPALHVTVEFWLRRFLWALPPLALLFAFALAWVVRERLRYATGLRLQTSR